MGTSSSYKGGTGGAWTPYKRAASAFVRYGGADRAGKALAAFIAALGGVAKAVDAAQPGLRAGGQLGELLSASAAGGSLSAGLQSIGLGELAGASSIEVLNALLDRFTGSGAELFEQAARSAMLDALGELLPESGADTDSVEEVQVDTTAVRLILEKYLALLIYNMAAPIIDERLTKLGDPILAEHRNRELKDYILALVRLAVSEIDPMTMDWSGEAGRALLHRVLEAVYEQLDAEHG
jgi:hypothetical protein